MLLAADMHQVARTITESLAMIQPARAALLFAGATLTIAGAEESINRALPLPLSLQPSER